MTYTAPRPTLRAFSCRDVTQFYPILLLSNLRVESPAARHSTPSYLHAVFEPWVQHWPGKPLLISRDNTCVMLVATTMTSTHQCIKGSGSVINALVYFF